MSHFTLLVALPKETDLSRDAAGVRVGLNFALDEALKPFDETKETEPYRVYEDGAPEDFWFVSAARREREHYDNGTGILQYEPGFMGFGGNKSGKTAEQQRTEQLNWKTWADRLDREAEAEGGALTWQIVVSVYDSWRRTHGKHDEEVFFDVEEGRAYTFSTYNPNSKWDWWQVGGRWAGKFTTTDIFNMEDVLFAENVGKWNSPERESWDGRIDGGRLKFIDLEAGRVEAETTLRRRHTIYREAVEKAGEGIGWSNYLARKEAGELTIQEARELYRQQPLKIALGETEEFKFSWDCPIDEFSVDLDELVARVRRSANTCYAFLTKDGEWIAPGEMGFFGMSSDTESSREAYDVEVSKYIHNMDHDDILVVLDLHI